jgi:very-short-patch-repair endonuclease
MTARERSWRRIVDSEQHLPVSRYENYLASALDKHAIRYRRQVKIILRNLSQKSGVPYYKVDFLIGKLVIEVESASYAQQHDDRERKKDAILAQLGYRVLRLRNSKIEKNPTGCLWEIIKHLTKDWEKKGSLYQPHGMKKDTTPS